MTFDPNSSGKFKQPEWATYVPNRHPKFKVHSQKGHATNALNCVYRHTTEKSVMYHWENGEWVEFDSHTVPTHCFDCGEKLDPWGYKVGYTKPAYKTPVVCKGCYDEKYRYGHRVVTEKVEIIPNRLANIQALYEKAGVKNYE